VDDKGAKPCFASKNRVCAEAREQCLLGISNKYGGLANTKSSLQKRRSHFLRVSGTGLGLDHYKIPILIHHGRIGSVIVVRMLRLMSI
jgi:hypothetical protein